MKAMDKKYFAALCVSLGVLFFGSFGLLCAARAGAFADLREALLTRHTYFARSLAQDMNSLRDTKQLTPSLLTVLCSVREKQENVLFSLTWTQDAAPETAVPVGDSGEAAPEDAPVYSTLPAPAAPLKLSPPFDTTVSVTASSAQGRYLYAATGLDEKGTVLTCAYPLTEFLMRWRSYTLLLACADVIIGALLAAVLLTVRQNFLLLRHTAQEKQRLIDNFSHELRTPLTAVAGYAEYLLRATLDEAARNEAAIVILEQTHRLQTLADRLLSSAAVREGGYAPEETPLAPLLARACTALRPKAQARGVRLTGTILGTDSAQEAPLKAAPCAARDTQENMPPIWQKGTPHAEQENAPAAFPQVPQGPPDALGHKAAAPDDGALDGLSENSAATLLCDPALTESLLINLLDNAVKACTRGGCVRLCAQQCADRVHITVQDDGCGMDAQTLAHLGEPFFRADPARSRAEGGAGLGLSLCFEIARAAGAALRFTSQPGAGTTAQVVFPAVAKRG